MPEVKPTNTMAMGVAEKIVLGSLCASILSTVRNKASHYITPQDSRNGPWFDTQAWVDRHEELALVLRLLK